MKATLSEIKVNLLPGFIVSLVALPLGFGLAMAAGFPPMAGIISAVLGGLFLFFFGGSHLTIAGPGNGLVVVSFYGLTLLGTGDLAVGYPLTLAAIVLSGVLLLILGLFRFGAIAEFLPTAAIKGMLAAIGLIILSRQLHYLVGNHAITSDGTLAVILEFFLNLPHYLRDSSHQGSYLLGPLALLLLSLHSRYAKSWLRAIPGPMWVVSLALIYVYLSKLFPTLLRPLPAQDLLQLPANIQDSFAFPDWSALQRWDFYGVVFSLGFIAAIESLLSIKAVDKLDPQRRRSNVNKDLRALGLATIASGLVGGMNVVAVIARSSVNVTNGATSRWANLFHGLFLLLFLLLFGAVLQHLPLSVLAAILVFTGYKLTAPFQFRSIAAVGRDELFLFLITYFSTLFTNLITGIGTGILATILWQLYSVKDARLPYLRSIIRPNTLLLEEQKAQFHLSVKGQATFLNFIAIKRNLDTLAPGSEIIVDFSLCQYVDHTVLEQLQHYREGFEKNGGRLELIGLDDLHASAPHPFAARKPKPVEHKHRLTRRQKSLRLFANQHQYWYDPQENTDYQALLSFRFFQFKNILLLRNQLSYTYGDYHWLLADVEYQESDYYGDQSRHNTVLRIKLPFEAPVFKLEKEGLFDRVAHWAGVQDINLSQYPDFSRRFKLRGEEEAAIKDFFHPRLIETLESHPAYHLESNGEALLIYRKERIATIGEIKQMVHFGLQVMKALG